MFIGLCARRSGLTGLRPLHLQERPRSRNGPIPSVFDSVSAYIEREGRAPPDEAAGWIADEIHYTLMYDPGWQDGGHNSSARLVSFISAVVARHLEREQTGRTVLRPCQGRAGDVGAQIPACRVRCGAAHSKVALGDMMQELSRDYDALGRNARLAKLARLDGQGVDLDHCEVFVDETCEDVKRLLEHDSTVTCRCLLELAAARRLPEDDGLTPSMRGMSFDGYEPRTPSQTRALADCQRYSAEVAQDAALRPWVILHGPPGVGKTHLAVSIMQVVGGACLVSWPLILDELRDNAGRPEEPYPQHISDMLYRTGLLVVDDFDKDIDSTWAQRQLYQLVSRRYVLRLPTVWTANTQLDQSVGPVGSRLRDRQVSLVLQITGPDHRIQGGR